MKKDIIVKNEWVKWWNGSKYCQVTYLGYIDQNLRRASLESFLEGFKFAQELQKD